MNRKNKKLASLLLLNSMILGAVMSPIQADAEISPIHAVEYGTSWNYEYTGSRKIFRIPRTGRYFIEAYGAQGQAYNGVGGGLGGSAEGIVNLDYGTNLLINVGGQNGYNGGGNGSAKGGGATDVRIYESSVPIVTGGGGGGGEEAYEGGYSGSESGKGGVDVGAGAGGDGINGGGGGRSYDNIVDTGSFSYVANRGFSGLGGANFVDSTLYFNSKHSGVRYGDGFVKITEVFTPPELLLETDQSELEDSSFIAGETLSISGSIRDYDNKGNVMKVMYQIDKNTPQTAFSASPSKSYKPFIIKPLIPKELANGEHTLRVWATDETGEYATGSEKYYYFETVSGPSVSIKNHPIINGLEISWTSGIHPYYVRYNVYRLEEGDESTLTQIESDTSFTKASLYASYDDNPPDEVSNVEVKKIGESNYLQFSEATKKGTRYSFYVEAIRQTDKKVFLSDRATGEVKADIAGYSYVVDNKPNTEPDGKIDTKTLSTLIDVSKFEYEQEYYVHIKTIDSNNRTSKTVHKKISTGKPNIDVSLSETGWTNNDVTITIKATSPSSKIERIDLPDGTQVSGDTLTYTVSKNGIYPFVAYDETGGMSVKFVEINKIDKLNPTLEVVTPTDWQTQDIGITIKATP